MFRFFYVVYMYAYECLHMYMCDIDDLNAYTEKGSHGKVAGNGLHRGVLWDTSAAMRGIRSSFSGARLPELPLTAVSSWVSHFTSLPQSQFQHL